MNCDPSELGVGVGAIENGMYGGQPIICWSRMQAEAGQGLRQIIARKETERLAGNGVFFWGVGNPPSRAIPALARAGAKVNAVFSVMLGKPKATDANPSSVLAWRQFVDMDGAVRELPPHVVVTSRGDHYPKCHYALMCHSERPLTLGDEGSFDPSRYRNFGGTGGPVGASQVTALLVPHPSASGEDSRYRINIRAALFGSYWVKLIDPVTVSSEDQAAMSSRGTGSGIVGWLELAARIRQGEQRSPSRRGVQRELFA